MICIDMVEDSKRVDMEIAECSVLLKCSKNEVLPKVKKLVSDQQSLVSEIASIRQQLINKGINPDN